MVELATALGHTADAAMYASFRAALSDNFNAAWLNSNGAYGMADGAGLQTASGAALAIGVVPAAAHANVSAALVADVATTHNGHWSTGIFGMRFLHAALTAIGQSTLALDTLLTVDYPGFGYWFTDPLEPATTLNELPDGSSEGPGMNSRNHHMFASVGGWLYEDLLGLGQARPFTAAYDAADPSAHGFRHAVIFPRATSHAAVPFASGSYRSIAGEFAVSWGAAFEAVPCVADAAENENVTLSCPGGGLITAVTFASFGTPTGTCAAGFAKGQCDAANSTAIVAAACVGKASCVIDVSTTVFGDPCFDVPKMLDAAVSCAPPALPGALSITVTVPANAAARVRLPFAGALPAGLRVEESGALVWAAGAFVPGVAGVVNATVGSDDLPVGTSTIDFEVLAGTFIFTPSV
jgi:alpha-L-rhamnosidase